MSRPPALTQDLAEIGAALLNWISTVETLGHESPGNTLDYVHSVTDVHSAIVRDFVAWTSGRSGLAPGCEERLRAWIHECGWAKAHMQASMAPLFATP